jgi:hypothetical protein
MKAALVIAAVVLATSPSALAEKSAKGSLKQGVVGTWSLVSDVIDQQDGSKLEPFGPSPKGAMILTSTGTFSLVILKPDIPKFASNNRTTGTEQENKAAVAGSIAYYGSYTVDEATKTVSLHLDGSTFPNWVGNDQKRIAEVSGDQLRWKNPTTSLGSGAATLTWKRVKSTATSASASR